APLGFVLSQRTGIPYGVVVYGTDCWGDLWWQDEWCLRRASRLLSISEWTKSVLVRRGYDGAAIQVVHPRIFEGFENVSSDEKPGSDVFEMLCIARLDAKEQYKGQDHVLAALSRIRKISPQLKFRFT